MNIRAIDSIIIPEDRIRREFDEDGLKELADSIGRLGLLQPIVLREDMKTLICGERRLRAHHILGLKEIEYVTARDLSNEQFLEAELEENVIRRDLSWQDQARAQSRLHNFRVEQHGEGGQGKDDGWNITRTAKEIAGHDPTSGDRQEVSDSLLLDEFLDDPIVAAAPSKKEAIKIIADLERAKLRKEKADNWDPSKAEHQVVFGDCYKEGVLLGDEFGHLEVQTSFDCIITDPPYGRAMHKHSFAKTHQYDDSREVFLKFLEDFPSLAYQDLTKPQAHAYMFHDIRDFERAYIAWEVGGWKVWPWPLVWDKGNVGTYGSPDQGPRHVYDAILFANKGDRPCIMMQRDVINITQDTTLPHPAGKPIELYAELLKRSTEPGDYVLDPMCGGGTIFPAASRLKLHATGIEVDEKYYHMSVEMAMEGK